MARFDTGSKPHHIGDTHNPRPTKDIDPQKRTALRSNGWTYRKLRPYSTYSKLYGERKYAGNYPDSPFRLLDLPAEIRNEIYSYVLCFGSIELSPKASDGYQNYDAVRNHRKIYRRRITPSLRLLRVNKQVNREAASIFYGQNEFRFSSMHGHDMLLAFCRTIGKRNTSFLRKISEHCPWYGSYYSSIGHLDRPARTSCTSVKRFDRVLDYMGLHQKGYGAGKFNIRRTLCRANGGVTEYTVLLPDTFEFSDTNDFDVFDKTRTLLPWLEKKSGTRITLVKLYSANLGLSGFPHTPMQVTQHEEMGNEATRRGWTVLETEYDFLGYYHLELPGNGEEYDAIDDEVV